MIDQYTQSTRYPYTQNNLMKDYYNSTKKTNSNGKGKDNGYYDTTQNNSSFQSQYDISRRTAVNYPLRKNYVLTNRDFNNKSNLFPTCHIGLSRLNQTRLTGTHMTRINRQFYNKDVVESIIDKLLENPATTKSLLHDDNEQANTANNKQQHYQHTNVVIDTEEKSEDSKPIEEQMKTAEEKRLKLIMDIHPKEYIQEAFTTESNNPNAFKSYQLQLNSLGNEHNRLHVLNGVNGYNSNSVKYKSLRNPLQLYAKEEVKDMQNLNEEINTLMNYDQNKKKDLFFGNENLRNKKKIKAKFLERVTLPEINYIESMEEKVNETVRMAYDTSVALKKRSELFRKKQKEYLHSMKK